MLYRAMRCKLEQGMVSLSRRRTFTKRLLKVDIPVPIDQSEVAFRYFTLMVSIDRKKKNKRRFRLKHQTTNTFLAWFGMSANNSSTVVSGCGSMTGVCSASTNYTAPNRLLPVSKENVSKINEQMKILETTGDLELCPCLRTSDFLQMTKMMCHEYFVDDFEIEMTEPTSKALIKQDDSIDLLVAMFKGLTLDDKREIKESEKEHFETFHAHRPYGVRTATREKDEGIKV